MAESLAPPLQINPTHVDNEVAGRLLLLNKNSTMISELTEAVVASNVSANEDYPTGALSDEELPPTMEEMVQELHSPIEFMDEELLPPFVVVAEEKTKHVATPNLNDITRTTRQKIGSNGGNMQSRSGMTLLLISHIGLPCHDDTVILTNHICLFQEDTHHRTNIIHEQKTNNINNEDADVEMNTDIHVAMEIKLG